MSNKALLLSIDLGTTACKAFVASPEGKILGEATRDYPIAKQNPPRVEQHAQDWWRIASMSARQAIADSGLPGRNIRAVSVSSHGMAVVPVDSSGEVLRPAISWLDTRAQHEILNILQHISREELFQITGKRASARYALPKIMWIKKHEPEIFERTKCFLMPHDYLVYRLTGNFATDHSLASGTLAHDVHKLEWSQRMLDLAGVDKNTLPEVMWAGTPVSKISKESAETLGLSRDAVVVCGGQDHKCAALGAGAMPGVVTISLGTASAISAVTKSPKLDPEMRLPCFPFVQPHEWTLEGIVTTAGGALKWLKESFFVGDYSTIDKVAERSFTGTKNLFFYPHLAGATSPIWNYDVPGFLYGITLATDQGDIARAVLEGVAYQIRSNIEVIADLGVNVSSIKVFGGGARSDIWVQIITNVLGKEVTIPANVETAGIGACILAGVGNGVFESVDAAAEVFSVNDRIVYPDTIRARKYDDRYRRYKEIEQKIINL